MSSLVAQRKAAIEAQLRTVAQGGSISTPSSSIAVSSQPSQYKKYDIKRVRKVPAKAKRGWGLSRTTYVVKPEQNDSRTTPRPSAPKSVPLKATTQPLSQPAVHHFVPQTVNPRKQEQPLPQSEFETQPPLSDVYYSEAPETVSLQYSDQEDLDFDYPGNPPEYLDHGPSESFQSVDGHQRPVAKELASEQSPASNLSAAIQRLKSRVIPIPSPPPKRKPVVREMADTNPEQEKEYEGTWQARKMVPPQPVPGMPTPDMAAAAAHKYNQNQERIQKAVRQLEGEEEPEQQKQNCCVIL